MFTYVKSVYFDYPLEQGLRLVQWNIGQSTTKYFDYPLEQGLRRQQFACLFCIEAYFDYPLEQGLRHKYHSHLTYLKCILIIH